MKPFRRLLLLMLLLAPGAAFAAGALGFDAARHLLNRTSFAASVDDINAYAALTRDQAADRLLTWTGTKVGTPAPGWVNSTSASYRPSPAARSGAVRRSVPGAR